MQAIILAAGMGKRLKQLTNDNTKCMVKVNGITIIERALRILDRKALSRIVIVVGYKGKNLVDYINTLSINTPIEFIENPIYDRTNNIYSLALAKNYLCAEDTLLLESDLVFEENLIDVLLEDKRENLALVDKFESWMDGTCMELNEDDSINNFIPGKYLDFTETDKYYKTVNIYKFSASFSTNTYVPFLSAYEQAMGENEYYESVIKLIALLETKEIRAKRLEGQLWYEIDNIQDLNIAESIFVDNDKERYEKISSRYGGHWRYPKLKDYCYLVNPYYPPQKMLDEMKSNFESLITEYPSGMFVNSLLVSGAFGVDQEHIIVGNGAAELIKILMEHIYNVTSGTIGCIYPTFEEYPNRYDKSRIEGYKSKKENFQYTASDLIEYYENLNIAALILINPDNPSGNYIDMEGLLLLIDWAKKKNIYLVIDESFVDFVDKADAKGLDDLTLIKESILMIYDKLFVVKSISKSYGIPGVRLGIIASSNVRLISEFKKSVSIWNINSYGEFFLQIKEKYDKDYIKGLDKFRAERKRFLRELESISFLTVYPSQANFVMCKVDGIDVGFLCYDLLKKNIFIKNLTKKIGNSNQYIRLAIRNSEDNNYLLNTLKSYV